MGNNAEARVPSVDQGVRSGEFVASMWRPGPTGPEYVRLRLSSKPDGFYKQERFKIDSTTGEIVEVLSPQLIPVSVERGFPPYGIDRPTDETAQQNDLYSAWKNYFESQKFLE